MALLEVRNLKTHFFTRYGVVKAVDGVSFDVNEGETLGLVGESGSGKSVSCLALLRLVPRPAGKIIGGEVYFNGENLLLKSEEEMRQYRGRHISMILQDPMSSLNPVFTISSQLTEAISLHENLKSRKLADRACQMLELVGIVSPERRLGDYPHQFSGGMRQRVVGAIALACQPQLLIADEPTTSLDATTQLQYLEMLREIQQRERTGMIFITHDLGIVAMLCDRVAVMYAGKIVEMAEVRDLFNNPAHPYTRALINAVPSVDTKPERLFTIKGEPPVLYRLPPGCSFRSRCSEKNENCDSSLDEYPPEVTIARNHIVRCWRYA